jgi:DNA-binding LacI/PurR family transcriptional regulator
MDDSAAGDRYRSRYRSRYHIDATPFPVRNVTRPARIESRVPRQHRVTIKEIARMTGVSTQTVSRVINNRPDVSPETRRSVEAAIAEHGFQPSAVARSLVQRRSQMLGVIAAGLRYFGVAQTVNGVAEAAEAAGYSIILKELASFDVPDIAPVVDYFVAHRVEGIIFAPPQMGANIRRLQEHLPRSAPPVVFLKAEPSSEYTTIGIDNEAAARQATRHLASLGRRRIAHISGPLEWREARDRRDGWLAALAEAGLEPGSVAAGDWTSASGASAFARILDEDPAVDGLFAASDQMALGALHVANQRGIRIPEQLAVVGFDGLPEAAEFTPSLTTVYQPLREMGRLAVTELLAVVQADVAPPAHSVWMPTEFIPGESAPLPSSPDGVAEPVAPKRARPRKVASSPA